MKARGVHPSIYLDGVELHRLRQGVFFVKSISPGKHIVSVGRSEVGTFMDFEAGKSYYFRFGHKNLFVSGISGSQPLTLNLVPADEARAEIMHLRDETRLTHD